MTESAPASRRAHGRPLVTFLQPYVPAYRVPFFDALETRLHAAGIDLLVAHGTPVGVQRQRSDAASGPWARSVPQRSLRIGRRRIFWRGVTRLARESTVVVQELASTNPMTYVLALDPRVRLMLWGHGKAYASKASSVDAKLEEWQISRAEHVFVYTEGGAEHLRAQHVPSDKITVVHNSTDTTALRDEAGALSAADIDSFRSVHRLGDGPVGLFLGALDEGKRVPLLLDAAALVHQREPAFRLVIAGDGPLAPLVEAHAREHDYVVRFPRTATTRELALVGSVAGVLLLPGAVGLVAVDALALNLPLITTEGALHGPEYEYLGPHGTSTEPTAEAFARETLRVLADEPRGVDRFSGHTVERMADAFAEVLVNACFDSPDERSR